jgi:hypothetical protein
MNSDLNRLFETFKKMNDDDFDTDNYLKWGYFFVNTEKDPLLRIGEQLELQGYSIEDLLKTEDDVWQLYITKVEMLSAQKLHEKNLYFNKIAENNNVQLYDGWDVEKLS